MKQNDIDKLKKQLWKILEAERKGASKLTSKKLSEKIGIGENYLSAIVNSRKDPSFDNFVLYLNKAGFDLADFAKFKIKTGQTKPHIKIRNDILSKIEKIDDKDFLLAVQEILDALIKLEGIKIK